MKRFFLLISCLLPLSTFAQDENQAPEQSEATKKAYLQSLDTSQRVHSPHNQELEKQEEEAEFLEPGPYNKEGEYTIKKESEETEAGP